MLKQKLRKLVDIKNYCREYIKSPEVNFMLYSSDCTREKLSEEVSRFVPKIFSFIDRYVANGETKSSMATAKDDFPGIIQDIEDTEENIWLPKMGLKGKIDLTVSVQANGKNRTIPLELKTGRASFSAEHKGQVTLYQMMMSESGRDAQSGLLLYLREGVLREVVSTRNEQRDLIMLRNDLVRYLSRESIQKYGENEFLEYPEPISHRNACENCPYNTICTSLLSRDGNKSLPSHHPLVKCQKVDHLSEKDLNYFFKWCQIAYLEDKDALRKVAVSNIWTETEDQRRRNRKTIFGLKLKTIQEKELGEYHHVFEGEMTAGQHDLKANDYVVVSVADDKWAVVTGFVVSVFDQRVTLNLSKKLSEFRDQKIRIDLYESQSMLSYHLTNLGILLNDSERSSRIRNAISGQMPPSFDDQGSVIWSTKQVQEIMEKLNDGQQNAIKKSLNCQNYLLIKGPPGTGKTQTISSLIRILVMSGQSVLITAHTHSAIDNLLLRIKKHGLSFLRLGSAARSHPEISEYCESNVIAKCHSPEEIADKFNSFPIVAVTCLGAGHALLARRQFDVCIVDEATQVVQTALLRPLFSCKKFILVGDPDQLPPVLQSEEAIQLGGDRSLFLDLDNEHANTTAKLTVQYRMNRTIMKLANQFMYNHELICGNAKVEKQALSSWNTQVIEDSLERKLLVKLLSPHMDLATMLVDTGPVEELNQLGDRSKTKVNANHCEIALIVRIIAVLKEAVDIPFSEIGIIAPFRVQVDAIKRVLNSTFGPDHKLEVNTVDQYQGRDKDLIIYSGTRTKSSQEADAAQSDSGILSDQRRLNVAITRAKKKLILIGDRSCLDAYTPFQMLFTFFKGPQVFELDKKYLKGLLEEYSKKL